MGFHVEINSILRSDEYDNLTIGEVYQFRKQGSRVFFDDILIWLTRSDWTALAEIQIVQQSRTPDAVKGEFEVCYIYVGEEQAQVTEMFRRMYADKSHPFIYVLMSPETLRASTVSGVFAPESLQTEGFVHASRANQLTRIANKYYKEHELIHVVVVRKTKVKSQIKWEPATGGLYPHIYGQLNMDAVEQTLSFVPSTNNRFDISISL